MTANDQWGWDSLANNLPMYIRGQVNAKYILDSYQFLTGWKRSYINFSLTGDFQGCIQILVNIEPANERLLTWYECRDKMQMGNKNEMINNRTNFLIDIANITRKLEVDK